MAPSPPAPKKAESGPSRDAARPGALEAPRRLRRAEAVLARRTGRVLLVLEQLVDDFNVQAVLRTAESFGIQHLWSVDAVAGGRRPNNTVTKGSWRWLTVRKFARPSEAVEALRADGREIWATDLARDAEPLPAGPFAVPERVALVIGREADGVSPELLAAADRRVYLPMQGFSGSLNVNVATGLLLQRIFDACPEARGDLGEAEKAGIRERWYRILAGNEATLDTYRSWLESPPPPLDDVRPEPAHNLPRAFDQFLDRE